MIFKKIEEEESDIILFVDLGILTLKIALLMPVSNGVQSYMIL